jgi:hypothetical protein
MNPITIVKRLASNMQPPQRTFLNAAAPVFTPRASQPFKDSAFQSSSSSAGNTSVLCTSTSEGASRTQASTVSSQPSVSSSSLRSSGGHRGAIEQLSRHHEQTLLAFQAEVKHLARSYRTFGDMFHSMPFHIRFDWVQAKTCAVLYEEFTVQPGRREQPQMMVILGTTSYTLEAAELAVAKTQYASEAVLEEWIEQANLKLEAARVFLGQGYQRMGMLSMAMDEVKEADRCARLADGGLAICESGRAQYRRTTLWMSWEASLPAVCLD